MSENLGFFKGFTSNKEDGEPDYSREISQEVAEALIKRAETSGKPIILEIQPEPGQIEAERILGFNFDVDDILDVLKNGATGIYLAIAEHKLGEDGSTKSGYSLVLCGTKNSTVITQNKMFNYSKPCPCNCPRTGQTC